MNTVWDLLRGPLCSPHFGIQHNLLAWPADNGSLSKLSFCRHLWSNPLPICSPWIICCFSVQDKHFYSASPVQPKMVLRITVIGSYLLRCNIELSSLSPNVEYIANLVRMGHVQLFFVPMGICPHTLCMQNPVTSPSLYHFTVVTLVPLQARAVVFIPVYSNFGVCFPFSYMPQTSPGPVKYPWTLPRNIVKSPLPALFG